MKPWVAVDVETTGLDPLKHGICEVGMVHCDGREYSFFVPITGLELDPVAMEMNKYHERVRLADHRPLTPAFAGAVMGNWMKGHMIVCSPSFFDIGFLSAWYSRVGRDRPWKHRDVIDLKSYACGKWGVLTPLKNEYIGHVCGVEDTSDHTALADARWTAEIFRELIA